MSNGFRLTAATAIHKGDREYQQDQVALLSHPQAVGCVLGIVADGMGGRSGGRKASDQVMLTARQLFEQFDPVSDDVPSFLKQLVDEAHMVIKLTAISSEQEPHSTLAAFLITPAGESFWVHVGDSRIYQFRANQFVRRSMDHSYVQTLVDKGELTEEQANSHPQSNILMACLGTEDDPQPTIYCGPKVEPGDCFIACSDGVWHYFSNAEIGSVLSALSPRDASEFLISKARDRARGGGDNLSIVIVKVEELDKSVKAKPRSLAELMAEAKAPKA